MSRSIVNFAARALRHVARRLESGAPEAMNNASVPAMPDWLIDEMHHAARYDARLAPDHEGFSRFAFYAVPDRPQAGIAYAALEKSIGPVDFSHVVIVPWLKRGGADLGALHHIKLLASHSFSNVLVIATEASDSPWSSRVPDGVRFVEFGSICGQLAFDDQVHVLARLLIQRAPRVIHIINSRAAWEAVRRHGVSIRTGSRLFASLYCDDYSPSGIPVGYAREYLVDCADMLDRLICDNAVYPRLWEAQLGVPASRFLAVYFPTDFAHGLEYRATTAGKVLWAGRMDRQKRPDLLANIARRMPHLTFDVYGASLLDDSAKAHRFPENVRLLGAYDGFSSLPHSQYCCFLNTSEWDGLPNVLLEATAAGLPIASTAVGGITDFLSDENAYLAPFDSDGAVLSSMIQSIIDDPETAQSRWRAAAELIRQRHTYDAMKGSLAELPGYLSD
ncbi:glycosyltransferase family 4 protein [Lysobacter brunescens]|uniref:Glycosyltransferase family 4 protein n=1 Tax=Lysobacter brunescens TaxID=262323 RepID=A0ABW2Y9U2_9GAMM